MSFVSEIEVKGTTYNVVRASAVKQKTLLQLVGNIILGNSQVLNGDIGYEFVKGALIALPEQTLDKISAIVLHQTVIAGTSDKVTIDTFQDSIDSFYELVAKAIMENLSDFFDWLNAENAKNHQRLMSK